MKRILMLLIFGLLPVTCLAQLSTESSWKSLENKDRVFKYCEEYKNFISVARTELQTVKEVQRLAERSGFVRLRDNSPWRPGSKYYDINRDRTICLIVVGKNDLKDGARLIGAHIDSPRLELKARPLYKKQGFAMFQTVYHGGIKKYQWVNIPLMLAGRIDKTDGSTTWIEVGRNPEDPIFLIPDLAPHVDRTYRKRTQRDVIKGEELDPIVGSIPGDSLSVEKQVMEYLTDKYDMSEADFISAELSLLPAMAPRDVGFDRSMIAGYGHDDRLCSFAALKASMAVIKPPYTTITFLVDNEESGSNNNTGATSDYLRGLIHRLLTLEKGEEASEFALRAMLPKVLALSADVSTGIHPTFSGVQESSNASKVGQGVVIKRYGRGNDPNSEFTARFRGVLEGNNIPYQTHTYKVDVGGGGTIGKYMSMENMEVLDCGAPILSMHSPYALASKVDMWSLFRAFKAFYRQ